MACNCSEYHNDTLVFNEVVSELFWCFHVYQGEPLMRLDTVVIVAVIIIGNIQICSAETPVGADAANTRFAGSTVSMGGREYNYLALYDHIGPSGVPLGGIGVGCIDLTPEGRFMRTGINNWFTDNVTQFRLQHEDIENGFFVAVWEKDQNNKVVSKRLTRDKSLYCGMQGYAHTTYRGLFPTARIAFDDEGWPQLNSRVSLYCYSGLVPHNVKDSSLPCFWVEVTLANPQGSPEEVSVALSWADIIGRGLREPADMSKVTEDVFAYDGTQLPERPGVPTGAKVYQSAQWKGVMQFAKASLVPIKMSYQNYNTHIAILAESQDGAEISMIPAYSLANGEAEWKQFSQTGEFSGSDETELSGVNSSPRASAIAIKASIKSGQRRTFRFMVVWYAPFMEPDRVKGNPRSYFGAGDYGRWYHNYFNNIDSLISYAAAERNRIYAETLECQNLILQSNLPDWLKFKLINSAYTLYTNTILNKAGEFTVMEGGMGGLAGTMDVRMIVHPLYQKFFPQVDRTEMEMFSASQESNGAITHFLGHYLFGMATTKTPGPTTKDVNFDGTCAYIMQIVKDYEHTGDIEYVRSHAENIRKALAWMKTRIVDSREIPNGRATYDDYPHPAVFAYNASVYLMGLKAGIRAGEILADKQMVEECGAQYSQTLKGYLSLWNGKFFAYGCEKDSSQLINDRFHQGQIAGQFLSRFCNWGDILPMQMTEAALVSHFKLVLSQVPDYYANKVWDLEMNRGVDAVGSQCWPFQLEAFTAMNAIQAGYVEDGLDIMRHIQLVHLRNGWTWSQNLWNPAELTRMDGPVTWMILDVLAGAGLNVSEQRLTLGPVLIPGEDRLTIPLFYPGFWAMLDYRPQDNKASLRIIKVYGKEEIRITKLTGQPTGYSTDKAKTVTIPAFAVKEGAVFDLSGYIDLIGPAKTKRAVLPRAGQVEYISVQPNLAK